MLQTRDEARPTIEKPVKIPFNEFPTSEILLNPCIITESGQQL